MATENDVYLRTPSVTTTCLREMPACIHRMAIMMCHVPGCILVIWKSAVGKPAKHLERTTPCEICENYVQNVPYEDV